MILCFILELNKSFYQIQFIRSLSIINKLVKIQSHVNMVIGQRVRIKYSKQTAANDIADKVGNIGVIRGIKFINNHCVTIIVEFENHTRLWMFREELICLHEPQELLN